MNIGQQALRDLKRVKPTTKKAPPRSFALMNSNQELMLDIIESGGSISSIARELGLAHITVGKYLPMILGEDAKAKAKANGILASVAAACGKKNPKSDLTYY